MSRSLVAVHGYPRDMDRRQFLGRAFSTLTATTVCVLAAAGMAIVSVPAAYAADTGSMGVAIDSLAPLVLRPESNLRITGRLVNRSSSAAVNVSIRLRVSDQPMTNRATIAGISAQQTSLTPIFNGPIIDSATSEFAKPVPAGGQVPFVIEVPVTSLTLARSGVYGLALEALAGTEVRPRPELAGVQRTFITWFTPGTAPKANVVWLWPLADWPARPNQRLFLNDETPNAVSPGGRLDRLVRVGARYPGVLTWVADPEVLQATLQMTNGYQVLHDGGPRVGDQGPEAAEWLGAVRQAVLRNGTSQMSRGLLTSPYADIDARASRRAGLADDVVESVTGGSRIAAQVLDVPITGSIAWAPRGRIERSTASLLHSAGVRDLVVTGLDQNDVPLTPVQQYSANIPGLRIVYVDPVLSGALATRQDTSEDVTLARQRFLAETAIIAQRSNEAERTVVIGPPNMRWDPQPRILNALLRATRQSPWVTPRGLGDIASEPTTDLRPANGSSTSPGSELSRDYLDRIRTMQNQLDRFTSVLSNPAVVWTEGSQALLRAQSTAWRTEPWTGIDLLQVIGQEVQASLAGVTVLSEGSITFSGDTGRIPITLANDLDQTVTVGVRLVGEPRVRLVTDDVTSLEIPPHRKVSIDVDVKVVGSEALPVRIMVLTPDGRVLQTRGTIMVLSTAYARVAGWVVIAAFAAIAIFVVLGVTRRIIAVRGSRQAGKQDEPPEPSHE